MMIVEFREKAGSGGTKITARLKNLHSVPNWLHEFL
jgi:hypothetical protein